jgi:hypothetical protein
VIHEVKAVGVAVGNVAADFTRSTAEFLAGLEGLVEDRAGEEVAHLQADQRLPPRAVGFDTSTSRQ